MMLNRTLQSRLAIFYGGAFLLCGIVLLAIPNIALYQGRSTQHVGQSTVDHQNDTHQLLIASAIALVVLVPVSLGLGWLASGRLLQPLRRITATAQQISASNLRQRLALGNASADELRRLGDVLDGLFDRLEAAFEAQRQFVANASHELRTPLSGQRTLLQVALADPDASVESLRTACQEAIALGQQQDELLSALLVLAAGEQAVDEWTTVDLAAIGRAALANRSRAITVHSELSAALMSGDPRLVTSLVTNLIDNAFTHNVAGGRVEISTHATPSHAVIVVSNTGPVIPAGEIDRLFQPFQRLEGRTGHRGRAHGLGLAIVRAIVLSHNADLTAHPRPEGGLHIEVSFPAP